MLLYRRRLNIFFHRTLSIYLHRCGPCKQFTPVLAQFYADMNKKGKKFEVIWVSRDSTQEEYVSYFKKMPWLAVTIDNLEQCLQATSTKFAVRGIPHLVVLDGSDASVYTLDGRQKLSQDQYGLEFPWRPRTPGAILKRIVPASIRTLLSKKFSGVKRKLVALVQLLLEKVAPGRMILRFFQTK